MNIMNRGKFPFISECTLERHPMNSPKVGKSSEGGNQLSEMRKSQGTATAQVKQNPRQNSTFSVSDRRKRTSSMSGRML